MSIVSRLVSVPPIEVSIVTFLSSIPTYLFHLLVSIVIFGVESINVCICPTHSGVDSNILKFRPYISIPPSGVDSDIESIDVCICPAHSGVDSVDSCVLELRPYVSIPPSGVDSKRQ